MKKKEKKTLGLFTCTSIITLFLIGYIKKATQAIFDGRLMDGMRELLTPSVIIVFGTLVTYFVYTLPERFIASKKERENLNRRGYLKRKIVLLNSIIVVFGLSFVDGYMAELIQAIGDGSLLYGIGGLLFTLVFVPWFVYFLYLRLDQYRLKKASKKQKTQDSGDG